MSPWDSHIEVSAPLLRWIYKYNILVYACTLYLTRNYVLVEWVKLIASTMMAKGMVTNSALISFSKVPQAIRNDAGKASYLYNSHHTVLFNKDNK